MPHGHLLGIGLYIAAWMMVIRFSADTVSSAYAGNDWFRVVHQSV